MDNTPKPAYVPKPYLGKKPFKQKEALHRINNLITGVFQVRLIGDNVETNIYSFKEALDIADDLGLDLVEIAKEANPVVCRVVDYQKFLYEKKQKEKENKKNATKTVTKELKFTPQTGEHDFNFKAKHATNFLNDGNKVKAYVQFRGREMAYKQQGEIVLLKLAQTLEDVCKVEQLPKMEGNKMFLLLAPKVKK